MGYQGKFKTGYWTPVWIELTSKSRSRCELELATVDSDGTDVAFQISESRECELEAGQTKKFLRYVRFGGVQPALRVIIRSNDSLLVQRQFHPSEIGPALPSTSGLILSFEPNSPDSKSERQRTSNIGWEEAVKRVDGDLNQATVIPITSVGDLPYSWYGYEGVSLISVTVGNGELLKQLSPTQINALIDWLRMGGKMVISCGRSGEIAFGEKGLLTPFIPAKFVRSQPLPATTNIERYAEANQRIGRGSNLAISLFSELPFPAELEEPLGVGEAAPLVARMPLGFGNLILVTFDLDAAAIQQWPGRSDLLSQILVGQRIRRATTQPADRTEKNQLGYRDIAGQLRATLDQFPGITPIRFPWIVSLVLLYLLLIGPGDYFLFRKLKLAPHWTWVTFPLIVFGFVAAVAAVNRAKGEQRQINLVTIIDFDQSTRFLRRSDWGHIYSPVEERLSVQLQAEPKADSSSPSLNSLVAWQGLPGVGFGGLDVSADSAPFSGSYSIVATRSEPLATSIEGLPLQVGATRSLVGRSWGNISPAAETQLKADDNGLLVGDIVNPFPFTLDEAYVYYENWAYRIPRQFARRAVRARS